MSPSKYSFSIIIVLLLGTLVFSCNNEKDLAYGKNEISPEEVLEQNAQITDLFRRIEVEEGLEPNSLTPQIFEDAVRRKIPPQEWADMEQKLRKIAKDDLAMRKKTELANKLNKMRFAKAMKEWSKCSNFRDSMEVALAYPDVIGLDAYTYDRLREMGMWPPK